MSPAPDNARKIVINDLIVSLIADGIWAKLDVLWVLAAHDAQAARLNWKTPASFALTAVNSPTFTTDRGYAGNGTTSYLDTGWDPATNGSNYTQNNASFGLWSRTSGQSAVNLMGTGTANVCTIVSRNTSDQSSHRINTAGLGVGAASLDGSGFWHAERTASSASAIYKNGALEVAGAQTSAALSSSDFNLGRVNTTQFATTQFAAAFMGASFSSGERSAFYTALQTYMTAVGA
jgi:hypothetical protein